MIRTAGCSSTASPGSCTSRLFRDAGWRRPHNRSMRPRADGKSIRMAGTRRRRAVYRETFSERRRSGPARGERAEIAEAEQSGALRPMTVGDEDRHNSSSCPRTSAPDAARWRARSPRPPPGAGLRGTGTAGDYVARTKEPDRDEHQADDGPPCAAALPNAGRELADGGAKASSARPMARRPARSRSAAAAAIHSST